MTKNILVTKDTHLATNYIFHRPKHKKGDEKYILLSNGYLWRRKYFSSLIGRFRDKSIFHHQFAERKPSLAQDPSSMAATTSTVTIPSFSTFLVSHFHC